MYVNRDAAKLFERQHARDQMAELSRHLADDDLHGDVFLSHSRAEAKDGIIMIGFIVFVIFVVLLYVLIELPAISSLKLPGDYLDKLNQGFASAL
jgi:hypothetical protein